MAYRHDFITTSAFTSYTVSVVAAFAAVGALAVDAPLVAVTAASIAGCAFLFLSFVAWAAR